jgi:hypothetical protein
MSPDRDYVVANNAERARLQAFVARCSDADLERAIPGGWTVGAMLAHLAFWDQRALLLLERWQREGLMPPPDNQANIDWINDAAKPLFLALPPRRAAQLAVDIAEATDRVVETLAPELVERNAAAGKPVNLMRATHRRSHLDEIERALSQR